MKNLVYIGNNLRHNKANPSYIQVLGKYLETEGFKIKYASSKRNKVFRLLDMLNSCLIYHRKTDFVLIDTYSTTNFYYALVVSQCCRILNLPYIPILHGGNLSNRLKKNPRISKLIFSNAKILVSPSLYLEKEFVNNGFNNVVYIPNAIELKNYKYLPPIINTLKLLWVRSFSKIYNPLLAIKVLKKLKDGGYNAELCMVGPAVDDTFTNAKELTNKLNVNVKFKGKMSKKDWVDLAKEYNIFLNTTNFDNMPVSVIEAMALGLVVVSTNVGGIPFLVNNNIEGLLVNPDDADAFFEALKKLINNPNQAIKLADNARAKATQFDWKNVKHLWLDILN